VEAIRRRLSELKLGEPREFEGLVLLPLFDGEAGAPDYLTLDAALALGRSKVTEVSAEGRVPELLFRNDDDRSVLLLEGEELVGAKQNRVLNLTILAPPRQSLTIPVACVEAGRWQTSGDRFAPSGSTLYASGRGSRTHQVTSSMRASGARRADQQAVWADIEAKSHRLGTRSATRAMAEMYGTHQRALDGYLNAFSVEPRQVGVAFGVAGRLIGVDVFHYHATFSDLFPKLLRGYALDAIDTSGRQSEPLSKDGVSGFLSSVAAAEAHVYTATGLGQDVRLAGEGVTGGALVAEERVLHLSAFVHVAAPRSR
jgi:hypothetical protein